MTALQTNLNRLMEERGWKSFHLAAAINDAGFDISESAVYRWLKGNREPRAEYIPVIAASLDVTPNDLFDADPQPARAANE